MTLNGVMAVIMRYSDEFGIWEPTTSTARPTLSAKMYQKESSFYHYVTSGDILEITDSNCVKERYPGLCRKQRCDRYWAI